MASQRRTSLPPYIPTPMETNNSRKHSLDGDRNQNDASKRQRISSTTHVPQGLQLTDGTPAWNVTGHYKVTSRDLRADTTGYEIVIFHNTQISPHQLYARWTLGHMKGVMRFCPHPPRPQNQTESVTFYLEDFEQACNLKRGDQPGPADSIYCKDKWLMRWRAIETGMGLGKLAGGEYDVNLAFDFIRQVNMSFANHVFWVMVHNQRRATFDAYKYKELGPESFAGQSLEEHWASFEAEWKFLWDPKWPQIQKEMLLQGASSQVLPPQTLTPNIPHPQITRHHPLSQIAPQQSSAVDRAEQALKQQVINILSENQSIVQPQLIKLHQKSQQAIAPLPLHAHQPDPVLSDFLIRFELRRFSHNLNDEATSHCAAPVSELIGEKFRGMATTDAHRHQISWDKVNELIRKSLHIDLSQDHTELGYIQPMTNSYLRIRDELTLQIAVGVLLNPFISPKQIVLHLWSPKPTIPIILPKVYRPRIEQQSIGPNENLSNKPQSVPESHAALSSESPQQGNPSNDEGFKETNLLGKRKATMVDLTKDNGDDDTNIPDKRLIKSAYESPYSSLAPQISQQPLPKHPTNQHNSSYQQPTQTSRPHLPGPSILPPQQSTVSGPISSNELGHTIARQSSLVSVPALQNPVASLATATSSTPWKAPVAVMNNTSTASQQNIVPSTETGTPTLVSVPGMIPGTSHWTIKYVPISQAQSENRVQSDNGVLPKYSVQPAPRAQSEHVEISSGSEEDIPARREPVSKQNIVKESSNSDSTMAARNIAPIKTIHQDPGSAHNTFPQGEFQSPSPSTQLKSELATPQNKILANASFDSASNIQPQSSGSTATPGSKRGRGRPKGSLNKPKTNSPLATPAKAATTTETPIVGSGVKRGRGRPPKVKDSRIAELLGHATEQSIIKAEEASGETIEGSGSASQPDVRHDIAIADIDIDAEMDEF